MTLPTLRHDVPGERMKPQTASFGLVAFGHVRCRACPRKKLQRFVSYSACRTCPCSTPPSRIYALCYRGNSSNWEIPVAAVFEFARFATRVRNCLDESGSVGCEWKAPDSE